jgi:hypothetical protein
MVHCSCGFLRKLRRSADWTPQVHVVDQPLAQRADRSFEN